MKVFEPQKYKGLSKEQIAQEIMKEGFEPLLISNSAGYTYNPHTHPETKLLAILEGSMEVRVENETFLCSKGAKVIIPGGLAHSAVAGPDGCRFFWSEKLLKDN